MQLAYGEIKNDYVLVKKTKDIGRFYSKSRLGETTSDNHLKLNLIEAAYLLDDNKLDIYHNKKNLTFKELVSHAATLDPTFETKFIIFQNLRNRGQQVTICNEDEELTFVQTKKDEKSKKKHYGILVYSERNLPNLYQLKMILERNKSTFDEIWIAISDEEGDVTYYQATQIVLEGTIPHYQYPTSTGILLKDRALIFDQSASELLHSQEFYGKTFGNGLQISLVEAAYLIYQDVLTIIDPTTKSLISKNDLIDQITTHQPDLPIRLRIFQDLKAHHMLVKTGFKFGTHFRAYTKTPDMNHAEYLIHAITHNYQGSWAEISRAIRLAHSVNKSFCFALYESKTDEISYLSLSRLRP